jgi:hypothetical protein
MRKTKRSVYELLSSRKSTRERQCIRNKINNMVITPRKSDIFYAHLLRMQFKFIKKD